MNRIIQLIKQLIEEKFTGSITINFFNGGVCDIHKKEIIKSSK